MEVFHNNYTECKICNNEWNLKRYYKNEDKLSNNETYIMKKIVIIHNQKRIIRLLNYKELIRSYAELESMLKMIEDIFKRNDWEIK